MVELLNCSLSEASELLLVELLFECPREDSLFDFMHSELSFVSVRSKNRGVWRAVPDFRLYMYKEQNRGCGKSTWSKERFEREMVMKFSMNRSV